MITKFKCSFCKEVKVEVWMIGVHDEDRSDYETFRCNQCRERLNELARKGCDSLSNANK